MSATTVHSQAGPRPPGRRQAGPAQPAPAASGTTRTRLRRARFWIVLAVIALAIALGAMLLTGRSAADGPELGAGNPAPTGAMAVANVLKSQGVRLVQAHTLAQATAAVDAANGTAQATLFLYDPNGYLPASSLRTLKNRAATTVLVRPGFTTLRALAPMIASAGAPASVVTAPRAQCTAPAAVNAARISPPQTVYRLLDGTATGCFPTSPGEYALAGTVHEGHRLWVVGSTDVFDNQNVLRDGNAALALNLLGGHDTLVWYLPSLADAASTGPPSLGALTPGWVTPAVLLLIAAALAAAVWRGRRFGPLVIENLPVIVRAEETMEGRARLYQRSSARLRALDALRIGTAGRIAARLGLPSHAGITEIADAAAALTGTTPAAVRRSLLEDTPHTDAQLVQQSEALARLEQAVTAAIRIRPPHSQPPHDSPPHDSPPHNRPPHNSPPHDSPPSNSPPHNSPPSNRPPSTGE